MSATESVFFLIKYLDNRRDEIISFFCGDALVMVLSIHFSFFDSAVKLLGVFAVGIIGGLGGLVIKDVYAFGKDFIRKLYKHLTRKRGL